MAWVQSIFKVDVTLLPNNTIDRPLAGLSFPVASTVVTVGHVEAFSR